MLTWAKIIRIKDQSHYKYFMQTTSIGSLIQLASFGKEFYLERERQSMSIIVLVASMYAHTVFLVGVKLYPLHIHCVLLSCFFYYF